jgi:hypothetical protein
LGCSHELVGRALAVEYWQKSTGSRALVADRR